MLLSPPKFWNQEPQPEQEQEQEQEQKQAIEAVLQTPMTKEQCICLKQEQEAATASEVSVVRGPGYKEAYKEAKVRQRYGRVK